MRIPFTVDDFLATFVRYNDAVWPAQALLTGLALVLLVVAARGGSRAGGWIAGGLAGMWVWMALAYHVAFFRAINPAAALFASLFILEAAVLVWCGVVHRTLRYSGGAPDGASSAGWVLIGYALIGYPLLGWAVGHHYPEAATFGLPCPTTIFTLGVLLLARAPVPWAVAAVPLLWSVVGFSAAAQLHMIEDFGLAAAGLVYVTARLGVAGGWVRDRTVRP